MQDTGRYRVPETVGLKVKSSVHLWSLKEIWRKSEDHLEALEGLRRLQNVNQGEQRNLGVS